MTSTTPVQYKNLIQHINDASFNNQATVTLVWEYQNSHTAILITILDKLNGKNYKNIYQFQQGQQSKTVVLCVIEGSQNFIKQDWQQKIGEDNQNIQITFSHIYDKNIEISQQAIMFPKQDLLSELYYKQQNINLEQYDCYDYKVALVVCKQEEDNYKIMKQFIRLNKTQMYNKYLQNDNQHYKRIVGDFLKNGKNCYIWVIGFNSETLQFIMFKIKELKYQAFYLLDKLLNLKCQPHTFQQIQQNYPQLKLKKIQNPDILENQCILQNQNLYTLQNQTLITNAKYLKQLFRLGIEYDKVYLTNSDANSQYQISERQIYYRFEANSQTRFSEFIRQKNLQIKFLYTIENNNNNKLFYHKYFTYQQKSWIQALFIYFYQTATTFDILYPTSSILYTKSLHQHNSGQIQGIFTPSSNLHNTNETDKKFETISQAINFFQNQIKHNTGRISFR